MDTTTYDKHAHHPIGFGGYEARKGVPTSIVVHSTSNPNVKNTDFEAEAKFLLDTPLAGAHFLIGKDGHIVRFLEPRAWAAWHAGAALSDYSNQRSIGIELHHSVGDPPYPRAQLDALRDLLLSLMAEFGIPATNIETHGQIALPGPYKRKTDPSDMSHDWFLQFRAGLAAGAPPPDPFQAWGPIGKPEGAAEGFAVPRAWLVNKRLGACVQAETYSSTGKYSITEFQNGLILYYKQRNATEVVLF